MVAHVLFPPLNNNSHFIVAQGITIRMHGIYLTSGWVVYYLRWDQISDQHCPNYSYSRSISHINQILPVTLTIYNFRETCLKSFLTISLFLVFSPNFYCSACFSVKCIYIAYHIHLYPAITKLSFIACVKLRFKIFLNLFDQFGIAKKVAAVVLPMKSLPA